MEHKSLDPIQKAFNINLDNKIYGTFAEIGAGQEVARHFFRAGGAAGTIAKSMSAYDMAVSDDIYGKSGRYVSQERVDTMLDHEFEQLTDRLGPTRGKDTCFFAFADTVAARSFKYHADCHGWLGVRFQHEPLAPSSQMIIHIRMHDKANLQQQEALGVLGTNLIFNCFRNLNNREDFVISLMDNLSKERVSIDLIEVTGPAFSHEDHRLWPLELVKRSYTEAVLFDPLGKVSQAKDAFYKKNVLVSRGSYRPPTHVNIDMIDTGLEAFKSKLSKMKESCADADIVVVPEISMSKLKERGSVSSEDFLARVDLIGTLGYDCLITSYPTYGELSHYLSECTSYQIAFIMGHYNLQEVFGHEDYCHSFGGLFTALGKLIGDRSQLFVYPAAKDDGESLLLAKDAAVQENVKPLIKYLEDIGRLSNIENVNKEHFTIWSRVVLKMIQSNEAGWEEMVPESIVKHVKEKCLFDYPFKPDKVKKSEYGK
jgi:hypothetical protein